MNIPIEIWVFVLGFITEMARYWWNTDQLILRLWIASAILAGMTSVCVCLAIPIVVSSSGSSKIESMQYISGILIGLIGWDRFRSILIEPILLKIEELIEKKIK